MVSTQQSGKRDPRPQEPAKVGLNTTDKSPATTCHALIDTGSTTTVITEQIAATLGLDLEQLPTVEVRGFNGELVDEYPSTDSLWASLLGHSPRALPEVVIVPDNALNYQAIVGMDYLEHYEFAVRSGRFGPI